MEPICPLGDLRGQLKQRHAPRAPQEASAARASPPGARLGRANKEPGPGWSSWFGGVINYNYKRSYKGNGEAQAHTERRYPGRNLPPL